MPPLLLDFTNLAIIIAQEACSKRAPKVQIYTGTKVEINIRPCNKTLQARSIQVILELCQKVLAQGLRVRGQSSITKMLASFA
jgi:hypothetical protein